MKFFTTTLAFILSLPSIAFANCLFGENLVDMALKRNLDAGIETEIREKQFLTPLQQKTLLRGLASNNESYTTLDEFFEALRGGIWIRTVIDTAHAKNYTMYLYDTCDNVYGFIVDENDQAIVARVGDGDIADCTVQFDNYDWLPWFYTN